MADMDRTDWLRGFRALTICLACMSIVAPSVAAVALPTGPSSDGAVMFEASSRRISDYDIEGLDTTVNLDTIQTWDVVQLIEFLALRGGLENVVIGRGVSGLTTKLKFSDVTVGEALDAVLSVNELAFEVRDGIITIMTDAEWRGKIGESFHDQKQTVIVQLKYADPVQVSAMLAAIKSSIGTVVADQTTGSLILNDTPEKVRQMQEVIRRADMDTVKRIVDTETRTFELMHADVAVITSHLSDVLTKEFGQVYQDERTRTLVVRDLPYKMVEVERIISTFDRRPREVFIEAKIVQVRLSDDYRLGVNWSHLLEGIDPRFALQLASSPVPISVLGGDVSVPSGSLDFTTIAGGHDLNIMVDALKTVGETKLLSNPHVAVLDGEEATIKVITDEPYAQAQLETGTTNVVGEDIKFIEVGVSLGVTPRISPDRMISMDITPEISSVIGTYKAFRDVPVVRKAVADTSVMIRDRETVIIAGMIDNEREEAESRVPFLGAIPVVGTLFKSIREQTVSNELIVFLTPRIVTGEKPYLRMRDMKKRTKPMRVIGDRESKSLKPLR
jgi:general secretion pathway protein D